MQTVDHGHVGKLAIEVQDVHASYRRDKVVVPVLRGISLEVARGEFLAIQGPSGSGKTTLLGVVGGLFPPDSGRVILDGEDMASHSDSERAVIRRRRVGFVYQLFDLLPDLTVLENVGLPLLLDGVAAAESRRRSRAVLARLDIEGLTQRLPEELSGGEMLRVATARALVSEPVLILADEPTGSLDHDTSLRVIRLLQELNERDGVTLIVVTHDAEVAAVAGRTLRLIDGRLQP